MVFKAEDIKHLQVMKQLGENLPSDTQSEKIVVTASLPAPQSFSTNILKLAESLRKEGFVQYAADLEQRFIQYKIAETHLYKVHPEEGKDLIEFAHPDGEVDLCPASEDLGVIETVITQQEKDIEKIQKQPHGKLSSSQIIRDVKIILAQDDIGPAK